MTRQSGFHPLTVLFTMLLGLLSLQAHANDGALYAPAAPKGSAFVRLLNAGNEPVSAAIAGVTIKSVPSMESSSFSFLPAGSYTTKLGSQSLPVKLEADHYYTLVNLSDGAPRLVDEAGFKDRRKSLMRLHNLTDRQLSVKTTDGKTEVISSVAPSAQGEREINPVKIQLALFEDERRLAEARPVLLKRGEVSSLFVIGKAGKVIPVWAESKSAN